MRKIDLNSSENDDSVLHINSQEQANKLSKEVMEFILTKISEMNPEAEEHAAICGECVLGLNSNLLLEVVENSTEDHPLGKILDLGRIYSNKIETYKSNLAKTVSAGISAMAAGLAMKASDKSKNNPKSDQKIDIELV